MIYQRNSAKLGVLTLVPIIKGMKIKKGEVLMYRKKKSGKFTTEAYELNELPFTVPTDVLDQFDYNQDVDVFKHIEDSLNECKENVIIIGGKEYIPEVKDDREVLAKLLDKLLS